MHEPAVLELNGMLPSTIGSFEGSQFPLPVTTTFLGSRPVNVGEIRDDLLRKRLGDSRHLVEPILLGAELVEAVQPDRAKYFLTDEKVQGLVFTGSKWRPGWALVLGEKNHAEYVRELLNREFVVFTDHPGIEKTTFIGSRPTSPIYFLQLMVRYGLVWGRIRPGDDHEMGHFLERDMPGLLLITEALDPLKYLVALGLMKLGAPAVVPSDYPFPYGTRIVADTPAEAVALGSTFPNLRVQSFEGETLTLPEYCNPAHARDEFEPAVRLGGTEHSFFCLRRAEGPVEPLVVEGEPGVDVGIRVEIEHPDLTGDVELILESEALKAIGFIKGMRPGMLDTVFRLELAPGVTADPVRIREAIESNIRLKYPRLQKLGMRVVFDPDTLRREAPEVREYKSRRARDVAAMTEENTEEFCVCTECRPFSVEHTCILTPDRLPMCASRTYAGVKAAALFGSSVQPFKRRVEERLPLRGIFRKGRVISERKGEYEGANRIYEEMTHGRLHRVQLHSLLECPHTSCGCFQNLAFWMPTVGGIGIMSRHSDAKTPRGYRWSDLANRAGGKQCAGIMGVSTAYIRSRHFLKADGGLKNVVWLDSQLKGKLADIIPPGQRVATEKDVNTLAALKEFLLADGNNPGRVDVIAREVFRAEESF